LLKKVAQIILGPKKRKDKDHGDLRHLEKRFSHPDHPGKKAERLVPVSGLDVLDAFPRRRGRCQGMAGKSNGSEHGRPATAGGAKYLKIKQPQRGEKPCRKKKKKDSSKS
jgi:hypothetical protein